MHTETEIKITMAIKEAFRADAHNAAAFHAVRKVIAGMEGKKVTKRVVPFIQAALIDAGVASGESTFSFSRPYTFSGLEISWWGKGSCQGREEFKERMYLTLTKGAGVNREGDDTASVENFDAANPAMGQAALDRNTKRTAVLSNASKISNLAAVIDTMKHAREALGKLLKHEGPFDPDRYTLEKLAGTEK